MDGQRFDGLVKAMANGATRRRVLRLAGGGLSGALLAAAGLGKRAGAEGGPPCGDLLNRCVEQVGGACDHVEAGTLEMLTCLSEQGGACNAYFEKCSSGCGGFNSTGQACAGGCPAHEFCGTVYNPGDRVVCRCVSV